MSSVKPLAEVCMIGRAIEPTQDGKERWLHEPCVTLADAERYAREKVNAALICERDAVARNAPAREAFNERVAERLVRTLMHEPAPQNHGAFYLETQADLVLKNRLNKLEDLVRGLERQVVYLKDRNQHLGGTA